MYALSLFFLMQFGTLLFYRRSCFFFLCYFHATAGVSYSCFHLFPFLLFCFCGSTCVRFPFLFFLALNRFALFVFHHLLSCRCSRLPISDWQWVFFFFSGLQSLLKLFKQPRTCGNNYLSFLCGVFFLSVFFSPFSSGFVFSRTVRLELSYFNEKRKTEIPHEPVFF